MAFVDTVMTDRVLFDLDDRRLLDVDAGAAPGCLVTVTCGTADCIASDTDPRGTAVYLNTTAQAAGDGPAWQDSPPPAWNTEDLEVYPEQTAATVPTSLRRIRLLPISV